MGTLLITNDAYTSIGIFFSQFETLHEYRALTTARKTGRLFAEGGGVPALLPFFQGNAIILATFCSLVKIEMGSLLRFVIVLIAGYFSNRNFVVIGGF